MTLNPGALAARRQLNSPLVVSFWDAALPPVAAGMIRVYRGECQGPHSELPEWLKLSLIQSGHLGAQGRWWTPFVDVARWYARDAGPRGCVVFQDVPRAVVEASRVLGSDVERFSRAPHEELFLPAEYIGRGRPLAASQVGCRSSVTLRERAR